jgi:hypothetical protein
LDVEDLGRVYEALLELEPGIASESMCRLQRQKLQVVVPIAQGEKYRPKQELSTNDDSHEDMDETEDKEVEEVEEENSRKKTKIEWREAIRPGQFYLRVGLGRKTSGSFYTPHSFVRFLVQETLEPQVTERSPQDDPNPGEILKLKVLDPAMGSGHFLVEACRFLGDKLYEACRSCDEKALEAEHRAEEAASKNDEVTFTAAGKEVSQWRQRIADLSDTEDELLRYLPSRAPEGEESGLSQKKAQALCRRLVAVHCLYGVDKNPLAVELAKLSLWLESQSEGLPLTFLDHRLVVGDSITGPFWDKLILKPGSQEPIQDLFHQNLDRKFIDTLREAIKYVNLIDESVGITLSDLEKKRYLKSQLDKALAPFKVIAAAWSGGVMVGKEKCDDVAYGQVVKIVGETGDLPAEINGSDRLRDMIAKGLGVRAIPESRDELYQLMLSGKCTPALPYDLTFPEVFFPNAELFGRGGFDTVLGNPPWNQEEVAEPDFWSVLDLELLSMSPESRRQRIEKLRTESESHKIEWEQYVANVEANLRIFDVLFSRLNQPIGETRTSGRPDLFQLFAYLGIDVLRSTGGFGMVLPSGFHNNEGAAQLRHRFLNEMSLHYCYSFENKRKLFEIDSRVKFACIVAEKSSDGTKSFFTRFYLHDDEELLSPFRAKEQLSYSKEFVQRTGGPLWVFVECRGQVDVDILLECAENSMPWYELIPGLHIDLRQGMSSTREAWRRIPIQETTEKGLFLSDWNGEVAFTVLEGKMVWFYQDNFDTRPIEAIPLSRLSSRAHWLNSLRYFRLAQRRIASSTNERTAAFCIIPPGPVTIESLRVESTPDQRRSNVALAYLSVFNTYTFDFCSRLLIGSAASEFLMNLVLIPKNIININGFLSHGALRLVCNHVGFEPLWKEQVGNDWREYGKQPATWPVLATEEERREIRGAIDAVVANAYGLSRDQYEHVLHSFDRASGPNPYTTVCLAKFDELKRIGIESFTKKYDPYWDIPLVETLPKPVIDLPDLSKTREAKGQTVMNLEEV